MLIKQSKKINPCRPPLNIHSFIRRSLSFQRGCSQYDVCKQQFRSAFRSNVNGSYSLLGLSEYSSVCVNLCNVFRVCVVYTVFYLFVHIEHVLHVGKTDSIHMQCNTCINDAKNSTYFTHPFIYEYTLSAIPDYAEYTQRNEPTNK